MSSRKHNEGPLDLIAIIVFLCLIAGATELIGGIRRTADIQQKEQEDQRIVEEIRNSHVPRVKLPDSIVLNDYELQQNALGERDMLNNEADNYDRVVVGSLTNNGDAIAAYSLHVSFEIYNKKTKKILDGAHCIVWNDEDINSGDVWEFDASDNMEDCFESYAIINDNNYYDIHHRIDLDNFVVVYDQYDIK